MGGVGGVSKHMRERVWGGGDLWDLAIWVASRKGTCEGWLLGFTWAKRGLGFRPVLPHRSKHCDCGKTAEEEERGGPLAG